MAEVGDKIKVEIEVVGDSDGTVSYVFDNDVTGAKAHAPGRQTLEAYFRATLDAKDITT